MNNGEDKDLHTVRKPYWQILVPFRMFQKVSLHILRPYHNQLKLRVEEIWCFHLIRKTKRKKVVVLAKGKCWCLSWLYLCSLFVVCILHWGLQWAEGDTVKQIKSLVSIWSYGTVASFPILVTHKEVIKEEDADITWCTLFECEFLVFHLS